MVWESARDRFCAFSSGRLRNPVSVGRLLGRLDFCVKKAAPRNNNGTSHDRGRGSEGRHPTRASKEGPPRRLPRAAQAAYRSV